MQVQRHDEARSRTNGLTHARDHFAVGIEHVCRDHRAVVADVGGIEGQRRLETGEHDGQHALESGLLDRTCG